MEAWLGDKDRALESMSHENRSLKDSLMKWQQVEQAAREKEERARAEKAEEDSLRQQIRKRIRIEEEERDGRNEDEVASIDHAFA